MHRRSTPPPFPAFCEVTLNAAEGTLAAFISLYGKVQTLYLDDNSHSNKNNIDPPGALCKMMHNLCDRMQTLYFPDNSHSNKKPSIRLILLHKPYWKQKTID